jgi:hypothetical protein
MCQAVQEHAPCLRPVVPWAYGKPTVLHVLGAPPGTSPILSQCGIRQGNAVGPLLFSLVLQKPLQRTLAAVHGTDGVAYIDDVTVVARDIVRPSALRSVMQHLDGVTGVRSVGLQMQRNKCRLYGGSYTRCAELAAELHTPHGGPDRSRRPH